MSIKKIWSAIAKIAPAMGLSKDEYKERLAHMGANRQNGSIKNLSSIEYAQVMQLIRNDASGLQIDLFATVQHKDEVANKMRKKCIAYAYNMKWATDSKTAVGAINNWLTKYGKYKKELNEHTEAELQIVLVQLEKVYKTFLKGM